MRRKSKKIKWTAGEKMLYTMGVFCFAFILVVKVFCSANINNLKMDIEKISYKIDNQEKKNQSLTMQVNELTSYENLRNVLNEMGLAYNNENIIVVK